MYYYSVKLPCVVCHNRRVRHGVTYLTHQTCPPTYSQHGLFETTLLLPGQHSQAVVTTGTALLTDIVVDYRLLRQLAVRLENLRKQTAGHELPLPNIILTISFINSIIGR